MVKILKGKWHLDSNLANIKDVLHRYSQVARKQCWRYISLFITLGQTWTMQILVKIGWIVGPEELPPLFTKIAHCAYASVRWTILYRNFYEIKSVQYVVSRGSCKTAKLLTTIHINSLWVCSSVTALSLMPWFSYSQAYKIGSQNIIMWNRVKEESHIIKLADTGFF